MTQVRNDYHDLIRYVLANVKGLPSRPHLRRGHDSPPSRSAQSNREISPTLLTPSTFLTRDTVNRLHSRRVTSARMIRLSVGIVYIHVGMHLNL